MTTFWGTWVIPNESAWSFCSVLLLWPPSTNGDFWARWGQFCDGNTFYLQNWVLYIWVIRSKFQINPISLPSSLFITYVCTMVSFIIYVSVTFGDVGNAFPYTVSSVSHHTWWGNVRINSASVHVKKLSICPGAESWWERKKPKELIIQGSFLWYGIPTNATPLGLILFLEP